MFPFNTRVNNVFPTGDPNAAPNMGAGMVNTDFLNQMVSLIRNERMKAKNEAALQTAAERQDADVRQSKAQAAAKFNTPIQHVTQYAPPPTFQGMTPEQEKELNLKQQAIAAQYGYKGAVLNQGQEKIDLNREIQTGKLAQGEEKNQISAQRAMAYSNLQNVKAKYQGAAIKAVRGGNFVVVKPDGTTVDTGIDTGTMTESDLQDAKNQGVIDAIDERGSQQRQTDAAKPQKVTPTSGYSTQKLNMARAQEFTNANPEMAHVVKFDPTNNSIVINPEGDGGMFGKPVTKEMRQKAYNWIYKGDGSAISSTTGGAVTPGGNQSPAASSQTGQVGNTIPTAPNGRVNIFKDGKYAGHVPKEQSDQATKQGFTLSPGGDEDDE